MINKNQYSFTETFRNIAAGITSVFVVIILAFFPLYTHDMYFDILGARYVFFKIWAIVLCSLLSILGIIYLIADYNNKMSSPSAFKRFFDAFKPKNIKKHIVLTDVFFFMMLIVCIISTIGSQFKEESFFGNAGRYQGLECWIIYFITYIAITRTYKFKKLHLELALIAGCFACIWGTLDFFWLDPFGFFRNVNTMQKSMFASSIGNLNTYTNYTIMIFAIASSLYIVERNKIKSILYLIASLIGSIGCVFGLADNVVLGFFGFYLFLPFFMLKTRRDLIRYLIVVDVLFLTMFLFWIGLKAPMFNKIQGSFFKDLVNKKYAAFTFIPFTVLIAILSFIMFKYKTNNSNGIIIANDSLNALLPKQVKILYLVIVLLGFTFVTYVLLDVNVFKKHVEIWMQIPSSHQLRFDDNWGTHRGHNWRIAFTNFTQNFDIFQKLFGHGPDTYLVVSERTFYKEMVEKYGEVYDSAHNEYINYLICEGALGLISYLGIFISAICIGIKKLKENPTLLACVMSVVAYMVQAIVNIAIPITTPVFFVLMYMLVAYHFNNKYSNVSE